MTPTHREDATLATTELSKNDAANTLVKHRPLLSLCGSSLQWAEAVPKRNSRRLQSTLWLLAVIGSTTGWGRRVILRLSLVFNPAWEFVSATPVSTLRYTAWRHREDCCYLRERHVRRPTADRQASFHRFVKIAVFASNRADWTRQPPCEAHFP